MDIAEPYVQAPYPLNSAALLLIEWRGSRGDLNQQVQTVVLGHSEYRAVKCGQHRSIWVQNVCAPRSALALP